MLAFIFGFIKTIGLPILYFGGLATCLVSIFKRAEWGLFLMVALVPQPNIFYKLYQFPMGQKFLDLLFIAVLIGIFVNKRAFKINNNSIIIGLYRPDKLFFPLDKQYEFFFASPDYDPERVAYPMEKLCHDDFHVLFVFK